MTLRDAPQLDTGGSYEPLDYWSDCLAGVLVPRNDPGTTRIISIKGGSSSYSWNALAAFARFAGGSSEYSHLSPIDVKNQQPARNVALSVGPQRHFECCAESAGKPPQFLIGLLN